MLKCDRNVVACSSASSACRFISFARFRGKAAIAFCVVSTKWSNSADASMDMAAGGCGRQPSPQLIEAVTQCAAAQNRP